MKKILLTLIFTTAQLQSDYLFHPEADILINELVNEHNFEENFVKEVLSDAKKKQKIIDSISKPAEFTWTWDRYKKLFIEEKRIKNGKIFIK
jgi:membrane-bound lytic murein transglycosylase B